MNITVVDYSLKPLKYTLCSVVTEKGYRYMLKFITPWDKSDG